MPRGAAAPGARRRHHRLPVVHENRELYAPTREHGKHSRRRCHRDSRPSTAEPLQKRAIDRNGRGGGRSSWFWCGGRWVGLRREDRGCSRGRGGGRWRPPAVRACRGVRAGSRGNSRFHPPRRGVDRAQDLHHDRVVVVDQARPHAGDRRPALECFDGGRRTRRRGRVEGVAGQRGAGGLVPPDRGLGHACALGELRVRPPARLRRASTMVTTQAGVVMDLVRFAPRMRHLSLVECLAKP